MPEPILRSEEYPVGFRITSTSKGLRIDCLGEVGKWLTLDRKTLASFGLTLSQHPRPEETPMPGLVIHTEEFSEGYRITNTARGLIIEPIRSEQKPLELTRGQLSKYGLRFADDHYIEVKPGQDASGIVDQMLATLDQAAKLMIGKTDYKWDVENLKRIFLIIGGLDEKVVQAILDEESQA